MQDSKASYISLVFTKSTRFYILQTSTDADQSNKPIQTQTIIKNVTDHQNLISILIRSPLTEFRYISRTL